MSTNQNNLQTQLDTLNADITALGTAVTSAVTTLNNLIAGGGATPAQLQEIATMITNVTNSTTALNGAIPPAPPAGS